MTEKSLGEIWDILALLEVSFVDYSLKLVL